MELAAAVVIALLLIATQVATLQGWVLLARPLWLDEVHTLLVASRGTTVDSIRALAGGADFNPPTLYLLYRLAALPFGGLTETGMRVLSVISVGASLGVTYTILRSGFGKVASMAGAVAVWSQSVVVGAAFEARFYGPLLLFAACFILLLSRVRSAETGASVADRVGLAVVAVLLCTVHYFGVLSWLAAVIQLAILDRGDFVRRARRYLPALAGPLALAMCIPLYLAQRRALTIPTWIPEPSLGDVLLLLAIFFVSPVVVLAVVMLALRMVRSRRRGPTDSAPAPETRRAQAPPTGSRAADAVGPRLLLGQGAVPLFLALFSLVVQPATQARYWIVGSLAIGGAVAWAAARGGRPAGAALGIAGLAVSWLVVKLELDLGVRFAERVGADRAYVASVARAGDVIAVRRRHSLYPLVATRPGLADRLTLLDPAEASPSGELFGTDGSVTARRFSTVERDVARAHARIYGFPTIVDRVTLRERRSFYVLEYSDSASPGREEFPGHRARRVAPRLFLLEATAR